GSRAPAREAERERGRAASAERPETEVKEPSRANGGRIKASPLARRIARERGVDLAQIRGTGPEGRVVAEDVERAATAPAAAAAAPSGLIVPVIQNADRRSIVEIAAARADLVGRAKDGKLQASDLESGTFTISNLGMYGVEQFVAVLNPPQAAILAVAATEERAVVVDGALSVRPMMTMTGTFDHRAVDGAAGADFLRSVKEALEEPGLAL